MRHIDFDNFKPDEAWLKKSEELTRQLIELHEQGKIEERNKLIKKYKSHWSKLKESLLKLSHNKCWFSETTNDFSNFDVEHFRPKSEAKNLDGKDRGGYWWLAFDYKNYRICGNVGNIRKSTWFPLRDGSIFSTFEKQREDSEEYFILDPIKAHDVSLIGFNEEGNIFALEGNTDWEKDRVKVTIEKLKLNEHQALTQARIKIWQEMNQKIKLYKYARQRSSETNDPAMKERADALSASIKKMTKEDAILSSVAKWCILFRYDQQLNSLLLL